MKREKTEKSVVNGTQFFLKSSETEGKNKKIGI